MDHCGDMAYYLQRGLEDHGYRGVLEWTGQLGKGQPWPASEDSSVSQDRADLIMWGKDGAFRVTIEPAFAAGGV